MTEHWSPINVWNRHHYNDHIDDDNNASKLSGIISSGHQDKEQLSSSIDESSRARPQREPLQILPNDFGSHVLNPDHSLVQTSGFKNGSEDMVSRVPPTVTDLNKLNKGAPPEYQAEPALTHAEDISFFGDSKVASNYSRSTLDQDGLHRGSITTLPSAGQLRGSAQQRSISVSDSHKSQDHHKSQDNHRSSFIDMAVATVATVGAAGAAAASGVTHAIMGSPTKEENNEMPSSWPSSKESSSSKEVQIRDSQLKQNIPKDHTEYSLRDQSEKSNQQGFCGRVHEPEIQGQNPSFYNHEKGRRWSEGWSHSKPADGRHTLSKDLPATSTISVSGGNLLGNNSSSKTGNLKLENITRESLHASQHGTSFCYSRHNSSNKNFDYGRRVSENSRLHEDFSQTIDHAPSDDIKTYKGVLASGLTSNISSDIQASCVQELPKETYYNSEDDDQYSNSGIPSTWGDQVLPIGQFSTDSEAYEGQTTHGYRGDEGINSVPQNIRRMSENRPRHLSQDHGYSNSQDHGLVDKFSSGTHSKNATEVSALASLGGLGLGHQVHNKTKQENHNALQGWSSNKEKNIISGEETHHVPTAADTGNRPSAQWPEINQNIKPKKWTKNDKSLPNGTGQDIKHENFIDHNLDINSARESTGARTDTDALETKKEKTVITQKQKAFGNTQQAAFGGNSAFGSSGKVLIADDQPSASDKGYDSYDDEVKEQESSHTGIMGAAAAAVGGLFGFASKGNSHDTESRHKDINPTPITSQHDRNTITASGSLDSKSRDGDIKFIGGDRYEENQSHVESSRDGRYESVQHSGLKATGNDRYKTAQCTNLHSGSVKSIQNKPRPIGGNRYEMNDNDIVLTRDGCYESIQEYVKPIGGGHYESNQSNIESSKDGNAESIQDEIRPIGSNRYEKNDDIGNIKPISGRYERNESSYKNVRGERSSHADGTRAISNNAESHESALNQNNSHTSSIGKGAVAGGILGLSHKDGQQNELHNTMSYSEPNDNKVYGQINNNNVYDEKEDYGDGVISRYDDDDLNINSRTPTKSDHGTSGDFDNNDSCHNHYYRNESIRKDSYGANHYSNDSYENEFTCNANNFNDNHRSAKEIIAGTAAGATATVGGMLGLNHKNKSSETDKGDVSSYKHEDPKRRVELPTQTDDMQNSHNAYENPLHQKSESRDVGSQNISHDNINQGNSGSQNKEHKSTVESVADDLGLDNGNKPSERDIISSTHQAESTSSENSNKIPTIHGNSKSSMERSHRNAKPSYGYDIRRDNDVNLQKSGKVIFDGTTTAAPSTLGLHNEHKSFQGSSKSISEHNKEVPGIPSENTYQSQKSNDHQSVQGKNHGINTSYDKDTIGGTTVGSSIGSSLALNNKTKQYSHDNQPQSNSGRRISAIPGIPSDTAQSNHSDKECTYKSTSYVPAQHQTSLDNEHCNSRDSNRRGSIINSIIGVSHNKKHNVNDSGYDRSSKYQDATIYSGRTKSLPSVEQHDQDVRGSRFNNAHTSGADVRGSRYNSIQGDGDDHNRYGKDVIGGTATGTVTNESHIHQQEPIYRQDRCINNESLAKPVNKSKDYEAENIKSQRKVSLPHTYRHGEPVRLEDTSNHGNNYESYEIENFKSDRLRNNSKSDKGIISTVSGMLGLNHDKDQDCRQSIDGEKHATLNNQYNDNNSNDTNSKFHKGIAAGTIGAAGATTAAVGSVLGFNKSNESENVQASRDSASVTQGKDLSLVNQKRATTENEAKSNLTHAHQGTTQFDQGVSTDKVTQTTTQSNKDHFIGHANQEMNTRQDKVIDGNQLDQSSDLRTVPTSSVSNNSVSSNQINRKSLCGRETGGVAAVGGMFDLNSSGQSTKSSSPQHISSAQNAIDGPRDKGIENESSGQRNLCGENLSNQHSNSADSNTSSGQPKVRTKAALAAAPHGNIYVSDSQYENAYSQGKDVKKYVNKSGNGAVSDASDKLRLQRKSNDATDQNHTNFAQRQLPTPPKDVDSISSTRATTGEIVPDVRNQEIKNRYNDNFQSGQNTIDEINNPKHRKSSISQGIKNKFNNAVRRLSSQGSETPNERRLSAAELYKNRQQATDHQQNAFASGATFGGGAAFGSASYQEQMIRETDSVNHHGSHPTNQHNEVIQENIHPADAPQGDNIHPTSIPQETGIHSVANNSDNRQTTGTSQKYVRVPGVYTLKPAGEINFAKVVPEDKPNAEGTVKAIIVPSKNLSNH